MPIVRIERYPHQHRVLCPFEAKDVVKAVPGAKWHPDRLMRYWSIPTVQLERCVRFLTAEGYEVRVIDTTARPYMATESDLTDWATHVFHVLGCDRFEEAYRALTKVVHPDRGGSDRLQSDLNVAAQRARGWCGCP